MASIRRTLSPVPRAGTLLNGEVCQVPSPLSKSSSCNQSYPPSGGLLSSLFGLSDLAAFILGVFSPRPSRPIDRSKPKGQVWRRALFHFFICFIIGVFSGLTPFASMDFSSNVISMHQAFSFEAVSTVGDFQTFESTRRNVTLDKDSSCVNCSSVLEPLAKEQDVAEKVSDGTPVELSLPQDSALVSRKLLIIVTPTSSRPFQAYYLNRLAHTLKLVQPPLLWIVVEMTSQSDETADILRRTGVMYRHLVCNKNLTDIKDKSVHQRNVALSHIETHRLNGIVYFADDDNIYLLDLFKQMRQIRRFGTWGVAKLTKNKSNAFLEGPICNGTQVIGWHINEPGRRLSRFHADMSGFAFNSTILWDQRLWHRPTLEPIRQLDTFKDGFQVSTFIEQVVEDENQMEGLMENCSRITVWHFHLESCNSWYPPKWLMKNNLYVIAPVGWNS